jgi:hypothetical protein
MVGLLTQLRQKTNKDGEESFEIILFSSKNRTSTFELIAEAIEKSCSSSGVREKIFDLVIGTDELVYIPEIRYSVLDLSILM